MKWDNCECSANKWVIYGKCKACWAEEEEESGYDEMEMEGNQWPFLKKTLYCSFWIADKLQDHFTYTISMCDGCYSSGY